MLIVDNADDIEMFYNRGSEGNGSVASLALAEYLPFSRKGSILFTTRNHKVAVRYAEVNVITVREMNEGEALQLLQASLIDGSLRGEQGIRTKLLDLLTHLPLAIKQAAAFMNANMTPVSAYLEIYESEDLPDQLSTDFEDQGRYRDGKNPIATTWLVSFRQIKDRDKLAADYLYFMSCIAQQDIPHSLLPNNPLLKQTEAIGTLKAYAFITQREAQHSYYMHRLVRIVVQNWLKVRNDLHMWAGKTLTHIANVFPWPQHETRDVWTVYLPHAQSILDYRNYCSDQEGAQGKLLDLVGNSFLAIGSMRTLCRCIIKC